MNALYQAVPQKPKPKTKEFARNERARMDAWAANLRRQHFSPWQIDRDLQAVSRFIEQFGPSWTWSPSLLDMEASRERTAGVRLTSIGAVRRYLQFVRSPDETNLTIEILGAWWEQLIACGRKIKTCRKYRDKILQFVDLVGFVWRADKRMMNRYSCGRVEAHVARETLRSDQTTVKAFIDFARDPSEDWDARAYAISGCHIQQICTPSNTLAHHYDCPEGDIGRCLTPEEMQAFFDTLRKRMIETSQSGRKGCWPAQRTNALFATILATGGRDSCVAGANITGLTPAYTPEIAKFSPYQEIFFPTCKSAPGGPPKQRIVPALDLFSNQWKTLAHYVRFVRPHLVRPGGDDALFLSERGKRLQSYEISKLFAKIARAAGLPRDLHAHCLRHTFATLLRSTGMDVSIISKFMGHTSEATTIRYAKLLPDYIKHRLLECLRRQHRESDA